MSEHSQLPRPPGGDVNRGAALVVLCSILGLVTASTTIARISVRTLSRQVGSDDLVIGAATIFLVTGEIFNGLSYGAGYGRHVVYLDPKQVQNVLKYSFITQIFLYLVNSLTKISICLFILRIKKTGWLKWCLYVLMGGLIVTAATCWIVLFAQCRPIYRNWDRTNPHGSCWDPSIYEDVVWAQVAYNLFADMCCTLLPVVVLWKVHISKKLKWAVAGLMGLGVLATICAAVRASLTPNNLSKDVTWAATPISDWAVAEQNIGIIAANVALSRVVYKFARDGRRSFNDRPTKYENQPSYTQQQHLVGHKADPSFSMPSIVEDDAILLEPPRMKRTTSLEVTLDQRTPLDDNYVAGLQAPRGTKGERVWPGH